MGQKSASRPCGTLRGPAARPLSHHFPAYHGTRVADPYRPLEDPDAPATRAWIEAENRITRRLSRGDPGPHGDQEGADRTLGLRRSSASPSRGWGTFYSRNSGSRTRVSCYTAATPEAERKSCSTPTTALPPVAPVALAGVRSARRHALRIRPGRRGLRLAGVGVREVDSGRDRDDLLRWIKFSGASWTKDGRGFLLQPLPRAEGRRDLKGAKLRSESSTSINWGLRSRRTCSSTNVPTRRSGSSTETLRRRLVPDRHRLQGGRMTSTGSLRSPWLSRTRASSELIDQLRQRIHVPRQRRPRLLVQDRPDAPRVGSSPSTPAVRRLHSGKRSSLRRRRRSTASGQSAIGFIASYLKDAHTQVKGLRTRRRLVRQSRPARSRGRPPGSTASGLTARPSTRSPSFTTPAMIYRYDVASGESTLFRKAQARLRSRRIRDDPGLLSFQGRDNDPNVLEPGRRASSLAARPRPCSTVTAASTSR